MTFDLKLLIKTNLKQVTLPDRRYYVTPEGNEYPSVTTLLGRIPAKRAGIAKWQKNVGMEEANRIRDYAGYRGTLIHDALEKFVLNDPNYLDGLNPIHKNAVRSMASSLKKHITGTIYGIELGMYSDELRTAGTGDLIVEMDGVITVCDFKTSRREKRPNDIKDYYLQATAYAMMLKELYGMDAKKIRILMWVDGGGVFQYTNDVAKLIEPTKRVFEKLHKLG
jgi:hypothetical protein